MIDPTSNGAAVLERLENGQRIGSDTAGLLVDLEYAAVHGGIAGLRAALVSTGALRILDVAEQMPLRYAVVAGQLHLAHAGVAGAAAADEASALAALAFANARMSELGSKATAWIFFCPEPLRARAEAAVAEAGGFEGSRQ